LIDIETIAIGEADVVNSATSSGRLGRAGHKVLCLSAIGIVTCSIVRHTESHQGKETGR
jgi:hypothetical protein